MKHASTGSPRPGSSLTTLAARWRDFWNGYLRSTSGC